MKRLERKHRLAIRWFHWINFPLLALMIWSGALIYWANAVYRFLGIPLNPPQKVWQKLHMAYRLADGMSIHFFVMWFFAINGVLYVLYTLLSGEWRELVPNRRSFIEAIQVTLHDLHLRKTAPPQRKYNGAQRISYTAIIIMGFGSLVSGMAIYKPVQLSWLATMMGGYQGARFVHFWLTVGYVAFFAVHIAQVVRTGWNNFQAMVTGYELHEVPND
ncbi:MAG TPA: cytochrome b/b6 domain-containing protein [Thermoanaerobaculia bacterium]|nr:cytochrome b/b6 domain-containing protein [Thermoanaerobaculia bacterium]